MKSCIDQFKLERIKLCVSVNCSLLYSQHIQRDMIFRYRSNRLNVHLWWTDPFSISDVSPSPESWFNSGCEYNVQDNASLSAEQNYLRSVFKLVHLFDKARYALFLLFLNMKKFCANAFDIILYIHYFQKMFYGKHFLCICIHSIDVIIIYNLYVHAILVKSLIVICKGMVQKLVYCCSLSVNIHTAFTQLLSYFSMPVASFLWSCNYYLFLRLSLMNDRSNRL